MDAVMSGQRVSLQEKRRAVLALQAAPAGSRGTVRRVLIEAYRTTARTLRRWVADYREGRLGARPMGRPSVQVPRADRQGVIALLVALGPRVHEAAVRALFPTVPWGRIRSMKQRMKRVIRRRGQRALHRLHWKRAGAVWAMDFTQPSAKLEGGCYLLVIVDLASGFRLAAVPTWSESGKIVRETLQALFSIHGRPMVIKFDNGSAFKAGKTKQLLERLGVTGLPSPVYRPQYNGSCERSLGHLKERIEHIAALEGHPGRWTRANVEQAREQANRTLRPTGARGPTPQEAFDRRKPITPRERERFKRRVQHEFGRLAETCMDASGTLVRVPDRDVLERRATTHALLERGYLRIRRGR